MSKNASAEGWPFITAIVMLLIAWVGLQMLSSSEPVPNKKPFTTFPLTIAHRWEGKELGLEPEIRDILKLSDYMMRVYSYRLEERPSDPVWLYVGYYQSQRTGGTYHSPKNCLPGAGWQFVQTDEVSVPLPKGSTITINKVLVQKGMDRQVILYWYHDRGRIIASEYLAKVYMMWDALTLHRTDGALVRISVPVSSTPDAAHDRAVAFLVDFWPLLLDYMPQAFR